MSLSLLNKYPLPNQDQVTLEIPELNKKLDTWKEYSFSSGWGEANASWRVVIADGNIEALLPVLQSRMKAVYKINGAVQATGYVENIEVSTSTSGGTILTISGRDTLGPACDSCIDLKLKWDDVDSIKKLLEDLFKPWGFREVIVDDTVNRQKLTGKQERFVADSELTKIINQPLNKKWRPHVSEGVYAFAERIGKRFGFHVWASADGNSLLCGSPDYKSAPPYELVHQKYSADSSNNVLHSEVRYDVTRQPALIIATGNVGGKAQKYQPLKVAMINELICPASIPPRVQAYLDKFKEAKLIPRRSYIQVPDALKPTDSEPVVIFAHDDESATHAQLNNFVRATMANCQHTFLTARYTVRGHSQNGNIWTPNTMVSVTDEISGLKQQLWIKNRTFNKSKHSGTTTTIECIIPHTIELFGAD